MKALMPKWTPAYEGWPSVDFYSESPNHLIVQSCPDGPRVLIAHLYRGFWYSCGVECRWVTHWMPLPPLPNTPDNRGA